MEIDYRVLRKSLFIPISIGIFSLWLQIYNTPRIDLNIYIVNFCKLTKKFGIVLKRQRQYILAFIIWALHQ